MTENSRVLAFLILHTGRPYLRYAIESIIDQVDRLIIFYSANPSQGFQTDIPCPDTDLELLAEVNAACPGEKAKKVLWVDGEWPNEQEHIDAVWKHAEGFDWIWRLDADEVSPPGIVAEMISQAEATTARAFRVPFVHFWRSFSRVCRDSSHPFRLQRVNSGDGEAYLDSKQGQWEVFHFGYAQTTRYVQYKMGVSGHRPEWRPCWFREKWLANAQTDVHPVIWPTHWMPEDFDKNRLPEIMRKHPYWDMAVIDDPCNVVED